MAKKKSADKIKYFTQRTRLDEDTNAWLIQYSEDDKRSISAVIGIAIEKFRKSIKNK